MGRMALSLQKQPPKTDPVPQSLETHRIYKCKPKNQSQELLQREAMAQVRPRRKLLARILKLLILFLEMSMSSKPGRLTPMTSLKNNIL